LTICCPGKWQQSWRPRSNEPPNTPTRFDAPLKEWKIMTNASDSSASLSGMTVNERLFKLKTLDAFAVAARGRDAQAMLTILHEAQLSEFDAAQCVQTILADPKKYGF
jgi:hypothetical protein